MISEKKNSAIRSTSFAVLGILLLQMVIILVTGFRLIFGQNFFLVSETPIMVRALFSLDNDLVLFMTENCALPGIMSIIQFIELLLFVVSLILAIVALKNNSKKRLIGIAAYISVAGLCIDSFLMFLSDHSMFQIVAKSFGTLVMILVLIYIANFIFKDKKISSPLGYWLPMYSLVFLNSINCIVNRFIFSFNGYYAKDELAYTILSNMFVLFAFFLFVYQVTDKSAIIKKPSKIMDILYIAFIVILALDIFKISIIGITNFVKGLTSFVEGFATFDGEIHSINTLLYMLNGAISSLFPFSIFLAPIALVYPRNAKEIISGEKIDYGTDDVEEMGLVDSGKTDDNSSEEPKPQTDFMANGGYFNLVAHILLALFTFGIWNCIWIYKTTKYLNRDTKTKQMDPVLQLVLCIFVPFYVIYWIYISTKKIDSLAHQQNVDSDLSVMCLLFVIFGLGIVSLALMQAKVNEIEIAVMKNGGYTTANDSLNNDVSANNSRANNVLNSNSMEKIEMLKQYKSLLDSGAITQEEYEEKKNQLL